MVPACPKFATCSAMLTFVRLRLSGGVTTEGTGSPNHHGTYSLEIQHAYVFGLLLGVRFVDKRTGNSLARLYGAEKRIFSSKMPLL